MPTGTQVEWINTKEFFNGLENSKKTIEKYLRSEFKRGINTFRNQTAAKLFRGPPGIYIPRLSTVKSLKRTQKGQKGKFTAGAIRKTQASWHIQAAALGTATGFFVFFTYLSRFAQFPRHARKLAPIFRGEFRTHADKIIKRIEARSASLLQNAMDGKL